MTVDSRRAPRILALDTATEACSAALTGGNETLTRYAEIGRGHAEQILPCIDELLAEAECKLTDLDAVAFGRGPGGFTGVRLAASVAQGLAFGARLKVLPVSNLAAIARRAFDLHPTCTQAWAAADARMHEVYCGGFERAGGGIVALGAERVLKQGELAASLADLSHPMEHVVAAGRGLMAYDWAAAAARSRCGALEPQLLPRAQEIAALAVLDWHAGRALDPALALPVYIRDNVAQVPVTPLQ
jgi:tRNA threonylcarbamoyladenosine biosynthesis protein TsaB